MKSLDEQKIRRVSTRMTQADYEKVRNKAKKRNMSISAFMVDSSVHSDNQITMPMVIRIQNLANRAATICAKLDPKTANEIQKEVAELWSSLK